MSCVFEEKCYNYGNSCNECMHDDSSTTLNYFEFNGEGVEPTSEEIDNHFDAICSGDIHECKLKSVFSEAGRECERCMHSPYSTTLDYFEFNGEGEEPTQEELEDEIY